MSTLHHDDVIYRVVSRLSGTARGWLVGPGEAAAAGPGCDVDGGDVEASGPPPPAPVAHPASIDAAKATSRKRNRMRDIRAEMSTPGSPARRR